MPIDLWKLKLICGFVIFVLTFIPSIIPFKIFSIRWSKLGALCRCKAVEGLGGNEPTRNLAREENILGHLMCFGGGVFFGTYLLHMSVEVYAILEETHLNEIDYPIPSLIIGLGFFLVLVADQWVSSCRIWRLKKQKAKRLTNEIKNDFTNAAVDADLESAKVNGGGVVDIVGKNVSHDDHHHHHDHHQGDHHHHHHHHHHEHSKEHEERLEREELVRHQHATHSIVLVLALSLHHIFEGMSIGLQTDISKVWRLTLSVVIHEFVIAFSLGLQFFKSDKALTKKVFSILFIAATILPIGVFIGLGVSLAPNQDPSESNLVNGVLQAIATGTFIYVTFFEILSEELDCNKACMTRVFATIMGFGLMALLGLLSEGEHEHNHGSHRNHNHCQNHTFDQLFNHTHDHLFNHTHDHLFNHTHEILTTLNP